MVDVLYGIKTHPVYMSIPLTQLAAHPAVRSFFGIEAAAF